MTLSKYTESSLESRLAAQDVMASAVLGDSPKVQRTTWVTSWGWTIWAMEWQTVDTVRVGRLTQR